MSRFLPPHSMKNVWQPAAFLVLMLLPVFASSLDQDSKKKEQEPETKARITEEILVIGKTPRDLPVSTVNTVKAATVQLMKPRDLSEAIKYAPGVTITVGSKEEYNLKLRGFDNKRVALLVDGVPVIDPYYSSFDLKTVATGGIELFQITKGPSSVLYGPNTLGGLVNVITRRPGPDPRLSLNASYGDRRTRGVGLDSSYQAKKVGFVGSAFYQDSDGFSYTDPAGVKQDRYNTAYERLNLNTKIYYIPSGRTEIMVNAGYYTSDYGMPPDLSTSKPRYWYFKDWTRISLNAGGYTALGSKSTLRFRAFYVDLNNTLDQYSDKAMKARQFESTFNNSVSGLFGIGDFSLTPWNSLKVSLYNQKDHVRIQDDIGLPWTEFNQGTFSAGIEDHITIHEKWKVIGGLSLDYLDKISGENRTRLNPLAGLKFSPADDFDVHISFSGKSRFPSMRSLYSMSSGNPDLLSESATSWELGITCSKGILISGSFFANSMKNMIDSYRLPDGTRRYLNIGKAKLNGGEIQLQKDWARLEATVNYTYLDHKNITDNRPLDTLPEHNLNFSLDFSPVQNLHLGVFGLFASKSIWYDANSKTLINIPGYETLDAVLTYSFGRVQPFIRLSNLFDKYYYTDPGFPWRGRFIEVGIKAEVF